MKPMLSSDSFLNRLEKAMDVMSRRQQLISSNVSNVETPGYRTQDLDFDSALRTAMKSHGAGLAMRQTETGHLSGTAAGSTSPQAHHVKGLSIRNDGNDVAVDREMLALTETRNRYDMASAVARMRVRQILSAIEDTRG